MQLEIIYFFLQIIMNRIRDLTLMISTVIFILNICSIFILVLAYKNNIMILGLCGLILEIIILLFNSLSISFDVYDRCSSNIETHELVNMNID